MHRPPHSASASAPASIGNVGVAFDIMGLSFDAARDVVTATREDQPGVRLGTVSGLVRTLPTEVARNTALTAAQGVLDAARADFGLRLDIHKGVPLSAGMGGSAASAVAGAAAANALLADPFPPEALLPMALAGEGVASDPPPWDNVIASLLGGLVLAASEQPLKLQRLPLPPGLCIILFHPAIAVETKSARALLAAQVSHRTAVDHSRHVAAFVSGFALGDLDLLRVGFRDVLAEPQRRHLLPCLPDVQDAATAAGAIGCSFSGSGPSVFALAENARAAAVREAMAGAFDKAGISANCYQAPLGLDGVRILSSPRQDAA